MSWADCNPAAVGIVMAVFSTWNFHVAADQKTFRMDFGKTEYTRGNVLFRTPAFLILWTYRIRKN